VDKTLALCDFIGILGTSEQVIPLIFKMLSTQGENAQSASVHARKEYKEIVVHLLHLFRKEMIMREKTIERKLVQAVKSIGGIAPKFVSPGFDGMPDRIVLLPMGRIAFVEVKRHVEQPRPLQVSRHGLLRRLGFRVFVLDDAEQIPQIINEIGGGDG
jgi:hypothetical protein